MQAYTLDYLKTIDLKTFLKLMGSVLQFKCFSEIKGTETWK